MNRTTEIVLYYLNNLVRHSFDGELESRICDWFETNSRQLIGTDLEDVWEPRRRWSRREEEEDKQPLPRNCTTIRNLLKGKPGRLPLTPEVAAIINAFHLSSEYHDTLALQIHVAGIPQLTALVDSHRRNRDERRILAGMLDVSWERYRKFFAPTSELIEKGLFGGGRNDRDDMSVMLHDIVCANCKTPEAVKRIVLGKPQKATLKPDHFEHVREEYIWLRNLLSNAVTKKQRGVNILIHGVPGGGKTELAKTLNKEIGTSLYAVSGNRSELDGNERRSDLAAALSLLQDDQNSVLLMDEAEDVFGARRSFGFFGEFESERSGSKSKLFTNMLLESNAVPVIWISNDIRGIDPAHLRRFSYALKMEAPDELVQHRIWNYSARKNRVKLPKDKIDKLVKSYDIAPAIIDTSLRTAALTGDHEAIEKTIDSLQTAMHGRIVKRENVAEHGFSTALLNCDTDLEELTQRITSIKSTNFSLCLYGVSGSGKSAYARFLAKKMKMKVLHKLASDLMSKWVGDNERNIATAFAEAKRKKMLLVFDEADSFLQDRRRAQRNWEVMQVNEMLTQMENHPLPFVCTTNLMDDLDQASLRRFTFKIKYDYLTQKQMKLAFAHFFGTPPTISLRNLKHLAPGDFAVVAKRAQICGIDNQRELVNMLQQEQDVKNIKTTPIGFGT